MPVRTNREYRAMPLMQPAAQNKRLESDYYVEGYATTFDDPYVLWSYDGVDYKEIVDRNALVGADLSDVIFQYNHTGKVYARNLMGKNKPSTLVLEADNTGFFIAADLGSTDSARGMYEQIDSGLISTMSWAFTVAEDSYNRDTHTRTILKVSKVYDVSAVSLPANPDTIIDSRSWVDGVIAAEKLEQAKRDEMIKRIKILTEV